MPLQAPVKLNTGAEMPTVGLGTWKSQPGQVEKAVATALKNGYTHIDTAAAYENEKEVGDGIIDSGVPREKIFLTTKLDNPDHLNVLGALESSLKKLQTPYLDLWLMHWPAPMKDNKADKSINWIDTWKTMEKVYKEHPQKLRAIGVSNVSLPWLKQLLEVATITPAVNQIELHPSCAQAELVDFCVSKGISVTAYSPLGSDFSPLLENEVVNKIAKAHNVPPATVLISLQANRPLCTVLTKSVSEARILANRKLIELSEAEIKELNEIEKTARFRACEPNWTGWGNLGFADAND